MKHPALTSALSVFLAVLCIVQLIVGATGFNRADEEFDDQKVQYERLAMRIERYNSVKEEFEANDLDYETALEELDAMNDEHHDEASSHRTDLAMYTATRSGELQGADMLWTAKNAMPEARRILQENQDAFDKQAEAFYEQYDQYMQMKPLLQAVQPLVNSVSGIADSLRDIIASIVETDGMSDAQYERVNEAYKRTMDAVNAIRSSSAYPELKQRALENGVDLDEFFDRIASYADEEGNFSRAEADRIAIERSDYILDNYDNIKTAINDINNQINTALESEEMLEAGKQGIEMGRAALEEAWKQLESGELTIQASLEMLWYELGKLDTQKEELDAEREKLIADLAAIEELQEKVDYYEDLSKRLRGAKNFLMIYEDISTGVKDEGLLIEEASDITYNNMVEHANHERQFRYISCILAIISAVFGILTVPGAFELIKTKNFIFVCALLCTVIGLASELIYRSLDIGSVYITLIMPIFALLTALSVLPQKKKTI